MLSGSSPPLSALVRTRYPSPTSLEISSPLPIGSVSENIAASPLPSGDSVNIMAPERPGCSSRYRSLIPPVARSTKIALPLLSSRSGHPSFMTPSFRVPHSPRTSSGAMVRFLGQNSEISDSISCRMPVSSTVVVISAACSGQSLGSIQIISGWWSSFASDQERSVLRQSSKVGQVVLESYWLW